jgi:hypothetical protein
MRIAITAVLILLATPLIATAQVYTWKDASGKVHYSDLPSTDPGTTPTRLGTHSDESDDVPNAAKNAVERKDAAEKQAKEAKEKAAKTEQQQAEDARRQKNCESAKQNLTGIESGVIRFRMKANGEREGLDGSVRETELENARQAVAANCAPTAKN